MHDNKDQTQQLKDAARLVEEVFTPALQSAVKKAMESGYGQNAIFNGSLYAFTNMLTMTLGDEKSTIRLLRDFASHLENTPPSSSTREAGKPGRESALKGG